MFRKFALIVVLNLFIPAVLLSQADSSLLTVQRIYGSTEFFSDYFGPSRWLARGVAYTTLERSRETRGGRDLVRYDALAGTRTILVPAARLIPRGDTLPLNVESYGWSNDEKQLLVFTNSQPVWRQNTRGDFWALDLSTWRLRKLGGNGAKESTLMFAKFAPEGRRVAYVRENNLYVEDLNTGAITQLTRDGSRVMINGTFDWVYEEELHLRDGWRWSPDGKWIAFWQLNADRVRDFAMMNTTDSLYSQAIQVQYPKAGAENSAARIGVVAATGGPVRWLDIPGDPRNNYLARMEWAESSDEVVIEHLNRLQNTNTVYLGNRTSGRVSVSLIEKDSAWVDVVDQINWLDHGRSYLWESERDGWRHVYRVPRNGGQPLLLTPGAFDVASIASVDEPGGWLYYIASPDNPTQRYLYRTRLDGTGKAERITPQSQAGFHDYDVAPHAQVAFHTWSRFGVPNVTELIRLPSHQLVRTLVSNNQIKSRVAGLRKGPAEFFQVDIGSGVKLNGWIMKPVDFNPNKKYPLLFTNYGGPGSQTVLDQWEGSEYLWNLLLTQKGYLVASIDNRGTGMRGRAWRKIVYRRLGVIETQDQANAARAMGRWSFVDSTHMGVFGWSYGGFMSLNGLFQAPEVYNMAISVAPVSHWKYYDNIYTERYNGLPQDNKAGYDAGSPLSYVDNLRGRLLLVHGTGDDNVHYQNSEALVNALVQADKQFDMMSYPNRNHGIFGGNTTIHLRQKMSDFIDQTLGPPKPPAPGQTQLTN